MDRQYAFIRKRRMVMYWLLVAALIVGLVVAVLLARLGLPLPFLVPMAIIPALLVFTCGVGVLFVWTMRQHL